MSTFQIVLTNDRTEIVDGVDGYEQEGSMTTFFVQGSSRQVIDSWCVRVASYRTTEIHTIKRMSLHATTPTPTAANQPADAAPLTWAEGAEPPASPDDLGAVRPELADIPDQQVLAS